MPEVTDQMGRAVQVPDNPRRIISLVPSQTELLYDLGLEERVVGITEYCVHPSHWLNHKALIGGTKNTKLKKVRELEPDLIIGNKEENTKRKIEKLEKEFPVWMSDIQGLNGALEMIHQVGYITGTPQKAGSIASEIEEGFQQLRTQAKTDQQRVAYLIWKDPWMVAGAGTFIHWVLENSGFQNVFADPPKATQERIRREKTPSKYPEVRSEEIKEASPELVLLSSEPYPFGIGEKEELQALLPQSNILLVDGEMFSWYGSRLLKAPEYIKRTLMHPGQGIQP